MPYIKIAGKAKGCILCRALRTRTDRAGLIIQRGLTCFCLLNKFPYNNGHLMVAPYAHKATLGEMSDAERLELMTLTAGMQERLDERLGPHGYNLGINQGRVAGAGVPGHLHLHVVPRWNGDTNFMPTTTGVKVMPMSLNELYTVLTRAPRRRRARRKGTGRRRS